MSDLPEFRERGIAAVRLLKGVVYDSDQDVWSILLSNESDLADYFCEIGLALVIDRTDGLAYLRQFDDDERSAGYEQLPRLFRKTALNYEATLLSVLLREEYRKFEEEDLENELCVVELDSLFELWKTFFPADADEVRLRKKLSGGLNQLEKLKFVRKLKKESDNREVCRLIKARIPIETLEELRGRITGEESKAI